MKKYLLVGIMILAGGVAKAQYPAGIWFTEHSLNMLFSQDADNQGGVVGVEDSLKVGWDGSIWRTIFTREDTSLYLPDIPGSGGTLGVSSTGGVYEMSGGAAETDPYSLHLDQTSAQTVTGGKPNFSGGINVNNNFSISTSGDFNEYANEVPGVADILVGDGTQMKMVFDPRQLVPYKGWFMMDEFMAGVVAQSGIFSSTTGGSGSATILTAALATGAKTGQLSLQCGLSSTGVAAMYLDFTSILPTQGILVFEAKVYFPDLSTVGDEYNYTVGWHNTTSKDASNGVYFKYDRSVSGNFWVCTLADGGITNTVTSTSVAATTWYVLRIELNSTCTESKFYIDNTLVHTQVVDGNINSTGFLTKILKSAGTNIRIAYNDYIWAYQIYNTPRTNYGFKNLSGY